MPGRFGVIGCGYVGMGVAINARSRGFEVTGTTTSPGKLAQLCDVVDHPRICRAGDGSVDFSFLDQLDGVLIAIAPTSEDNNSSYDSVFGDGVASIVEAIRRRRDRQKPLHVTYLSSAGVYGDKAGQIANELTPPDLTDNTNALLVKAEQTILSLNSATVQACVLRLGGIYGPGKDIPSYIKSAAGQLVPKNGNHVNAWIHFVDIIRGTSFAYERKLQGLYNLVDDMQLTRRELSNHLCDAEGLPPVIWENHNREGARIFNARVSNARLRNLGFRFKVQSMLDPVPAG